MRTIAYLLLILLLVSGVSSCGSVRASNYKSEDKIIVNGLNSTALEKWHAIWFSLIGASEEFLLLSSKENGCIDIDQISQKDEIVVHMERMFTYVTKGDSIGIRLNGRFDVKVNETGEDFIFHKRILVYSCSSMAASNGFLPSPLFPKNPYLCPQ
jgi:hypothetical protein